MFSYTSIALAYVMLLGTTGGEITQENGDMLDSKESGFLVVKISDAVFTYLEDTINYITGNILTLVSQLDTLLKFIVYSATTVIDAIIRQPANIINIILFALSWTLNAIVYVVVDVFLHVILEEGIIFLIWLITSLLYLIMQIVSGSILSIVFFARTCMLLYLNVISFIFIYIILSIFDSLFWTLSYVTIIAAGLWVSVELKNRAHVFQEAAPINTIGSAIMCIPLIYAVYDIWMSLCTIIFTFIFYPVLTVLYGASISYLTYQLMKLLIEKFDYSRLLQTFDREHLTTLLRQTREIALMLRSRSFLLKQALNIKNYAKKSISTQQLEDDGFYNEQECVICFNESSLVTLFPCEHKVICVECIIRVLENDYRCPICRATIRHHRSV